jgi:hypothetical protein
MNRSLKSAAIVALSIAALVNCSSSDKPATCPAGSETCACYGNGSCDPNLECRSKVCVAGSAGASGANAQGGQSGSADGGSQPMAGSSGSVVGGSGPSGGTGGQTGIAGGNSAGSSAAAGSNACGDTTSDPKNCGTCGHVCLAGTCQAGQCPPFQQGCFVKTDGFTTCTAYCASIGETCASNKCSTATAFIWPSDMGTQCKKDPDSSSGQSIANCDYPLDFSDSHFYYRCCCTDS